MPNTLTAREYKLLLNADRFGRKPSARRAQQFLGKQVVPIVSELAEAQGADVKLSPQEFKEPERRSICFRDTKDRLLDSCYYILRERIPEGKPPEITLKLRVPDYFVGAGTDQPSRDKSEDPTFEEDIAPLEVPNFKKNKVTVADPPSIRSRFSLSTTQQVTPATRIEKLADAFKLFPTLSKNLASAGAKKVKPEARMRSGPRIDEYVYKGPKLAFPDGFVGKLALTLWHFPNKPSVPRIAEISFKCKMIEEVGKKTVVRPMTEAAARSALAVFNGLQSGLSAKWLNLDEASKTELALPE